MIIDEMLKYVTTKNSNLLDKLIAFLKIQSISTDRRFSTSCEEAANWLIEELSSIGFDTKLHKTNGHPIVLAKLGAGQPHLLFYGHYDVQPPDPLDLWDTDPFTPIIKDGPKGKIICARGASDDKGQLMTFINACRAIVEINGVLPCKITILIEGEEESGSPSLSPFLKKNKKDLEADYALICDTGMWNSTTPAISTMLRGMLGEEITIKAANKDLHSGMYGGPAINPIRELTKLISTIHDDKGRITIKDFYKNVPETPATIKKQWDNLNFSSKKFLNSVGLHTSAGEEPYSVLEQLWSRPTCEVNGIWGGYISPGFKTVIPSEAHAKISFRLVGDQDPEEIRKSFRLHLKEKMNQDCEITFAPKDGSKAITIALDSPVIKAAQKGLFEEWGVLPVYAGCGGSIPVVGFLKNILNLDSLLVGFGLEDDQIHSPNEKYSVNSFEKGTRSWIRIINELTK